MMVAFNVVSWRFKRRGVTVLHRLSLSHIAAKHNIMFFVRYKVLKLSDGEAEDVVVLSWKEYITSNGFFTASRMNPKSLSGASLLVGQYRGS